MTWKFDHKQTRKLHATGNFNQIRIFFLHCLSKADLFFNTKYAVDHKTCYFFWEVQEIRKKILEFLYFLVSQNSCF